MVLSRFWVTGLPLVYLLFVAFLRGHLANRPRETVALIAVTAFLCVDLLLWGGA